MAYYKHSASRLIAEFGIAVVRHLEPYSSQLCLFVKPCPQKASNFVYTSHEAHMLSITNMNPHDHTGSSGSRK